MPRRTELQRDIKALFHSASITQRTYKRAKNSIKLAGRLQLAAQFLSSQLWVCVFCECIYIWEGSDLKPCRGDPDKGHLLSPTAHVTYSAIFPRLYNWCTLEQSAGLAGRPNQSRLPSTQSLLCRAPLMQRNINTSTASLIKQQFYQHTHTEPTNSFIMSNRILNKPLLSQIPRNVFFYTAGWINIISLSKGICVYTKARAFKSPREWGNLGR